VPLAIVPEAANVNDHQAVGMTLMELDRLPVQRPAPTARRPQGMCMDKGYDYAVVYELLALWLFVAHVRPRGEEADLIARDPAFRPRRWVVERTHSWLNRFRRLLVRWEKRTLYYQGFLHLASGIIAYRAATVFG